jgi:hypothetical protein
MVGDQTANHAANPLKKGKKLSPVLEPFLYLDYVQFSISWVTILTLTKPGE